MIVLWTCAADSLEAQRVSEPVALSGRSRRNARSVPQVVPVSSAEGVIAALLMPPGQPAGLSHNGVPVPPGTHLVRHADRLQYEGQQYWVAAVNGVSVVQYAPETHGHDVYCFITKVRLQPDEEIVVCPGRPGTECGSIFKRPAWDMAIESNQRFRCPRCGFEPKAADWQPALPRKTRLPELLELARNRKRGDT